MRRNRRRRLAGAGWAVGDAGDFLGLTAEERALVETKVRLAAAVRRRRQRHGLTQMAFAATLGSSQSRIAKLEAADASVTVDLLLRALFHLGATRAEVARIIGAAGRSAA